MFKVIMLVKKNPALSQNEFIEHWKAHSEKVLQLQEVLHIVSYSKTFPLQDNSDAVTGRNMQPFAFDAMGELWYNNKAAFISARNSEEGRAALQILQEDEKKFVDLQSSAMWFGLEEKII